MMMKMTTTMRRITSNNSNSSSSRFFCGGGCCRHHRHHHLPFQKNVVVVVFLSLLILLFGPHRQQQQQLPSHKVVVLVAAVTPQSDIRIIRNIQQEQQQEPEERLGTGYAIPGTTQTISGYDTEYGIDPICWRSNGTTTTTAAAEGTTMNSNSNNNNNITNPLLNNFRIIDRVQLLSSCPINNRITIKEPIEIQNNIRLRTKSWYNYTVTIQLNLLSLSSSLSSSSSSLSSMYHQPYSIVSDGGMGRIAVQVLVCELGSSGFCSPFIHEAANLRLHAMNSTAPKPGPGDSHGGTHVHSKFQFIDYDPQLGPIYNTTIHVPMLINEPGQYYIIGAVQLYLARNDDNNHDDNDDDTSSRANVVRYDIANAVQDVTRRVVTYQEPIIMLTIPNTIRIISYIAISISSIVLLYMIYYVILYRNHQVMKLTQGYFILLFLFAALIATIMCIYLEPYNDIYCQLSLPTIMCSVQLMYAISLGRLWRINAVISPLLIQSYRYNNNTLLLSSKTNHNKCCFNYFSIYRLSIWIRERLRTTASKTGSSVSQLDHNNNNINNNNNSTSNPIKLRRKVTSQQLTMVIWGLAVPQIMIQLLGLILQTPYQSYEYNEDESIGRPYCVRGSSNYDSPAASIVLYGFLYFTIVLMVLLMVAQHTKSLPSLFNETSDIYGSTLITMIIFVLGGGIVIITNQPTTSPAIQYLISLALILSITLNTSIRIVMPKLQMVWSGEVVLVSKLVSDHSEKARRKNLLNSSNVYKDSLNYSTSCDNHAGTRYGMTAVGSSQKSDSSESPNDNQPTTVRLSEFSMNEDSDVTNAAGNPMVAIGMSRSDLLSSTNQTSKNSTTAGASIQTTPFMSLRNLFTPSRFFDNAAIDESTMNHSEDVTQQNHGIDVSVPSSRNPQQQRSSSLLRQSKNGNNNNNRISFDEENLIHETTILISNDTAPSRRLVLPLVEIQCKLQEINQRIMSGLCVSEDDWILLRKQCIALGTTFQNNVQFQWEEQKQQQKTDDSISKSNVHLESTLLTSEPHRESALSTSEPQRESALSTSEPQSTPFIYPQQKSQYRKNGYVPQPIKRLPSYRLSSLLTFKENETDDDDEDSIHEDEYNLNAKFRLEL